MIRPAVEKDGSWGGGGCFGLGFSDLGFRV